MNSKIDILLCWFIFCINSYTNDMRIWLWLFYLIEILLSLQKSFFSVETVYTGIDILFVKSYLFLS